MCGICGILTTSPTPEFQPQVARMCAAMTHRGPDDEGFFFAPYISLGMRRLSIIDLDTGRQPIFSEDGQIAIVFNGEIYNYRDLRTQLEARGHRFATHTDTEVIVHLYEEYGYNCLHHLRGMFAFAVWDSRNQILFLARDRLGIKPLYYAKRQGVFLFASELKALLSSGFIERQISWQGLHHYLSFYSVPAPYTILNDVWALPPGHAMLVRPEQHLVFQYWDLQFNKYPEIAALPAVEITRQLRMLLEESVRIRLMSDVPLGAFLSGGIDSSVVVGLMARMMNRPVQTYSIGFEQANRRIDERPFARLAAERFGTDHTEVIITGQTVLNHLDHLIYSLDQPSGDAVNTYFVSQAARSGVTVAMSGLGGDELFAGYPHFRTLAALPRYQVAGMRMPPPLRSVLRAAISRIPGRFKRQPWLQPLVRLDLASDTLTAQYFRAGRGLYNEAAKAELYAAGVRSNLTGLESAETFLRQFLSPKPLDVAQQVGRLEFKTYLPYTLLRDTDAMSMAHSLEVRVPLIDHKLVEFVNSIPSAYKLNGSFSKQILVDAVKDILPPEVWQRRKMGFELPMYRWLNHELKPVVDEVLSPAVMRRRGLFRPEAIAQIRRRRGTYLRVWSLVVLELWLQKYID
ncbi:asparagine synthase (glutamine-hydrolyzing) [Candidatus Parcubacteria bacterium]|nr:MAG: asparagine synthase (glutamine-hydrolyzing) [Candidatus Parcubacteria bacterium]